MALANWAYSHHEFPCLDETLTIWAGVATDNELNNAWKLLTLHTKPTKLRKMSKDTLLKVIAARTPKVLQNEQAQRQHNIELEVNALIQHFKTKEENIVMNALRKKSSKTPEVLFKDFYWISLEEVK